MPSVIVNYCNEYFQCVVHFARCLHLMNTVSSTVRNLLVLVA